MRVAGVIWQRVPAAQLPSTFGHPRVPAPQAEPALDRPFEPWPGSAEAPRTWRPSERGLTPLGESSVTELRIYTGRHGRDRVTRAPHRDERARDRGGGGR